VTDDEREAGYLPALLINPWRTARRLIVLAFCDDDAPRRFALGDAFERVEPDPRATTPDPRGRSHFHLTAPRTSPMWAKIKSTAKAVWHWFACVFLPRLWCAVCAIARCVWRFAVAVAKTFRDQLKATGSDKALINGEDIKRSAAFAATVVGSGVGSFCLTIAIIGLHGIQAIIAFLPLGVPGAIASWVVVFVLKLAVRLNQGKDPLATPAAT
jgi:hypothetical protein